MEQDSLKRLKRANLKRAILSTVQLSGLLSVALLAPNVLTALHKLGFIGGARREESIRTARNRLVKQGYIVIREDKASITQKGERELRRLGSYHVHSARPRAWDGKWRVLVFDIPNYRKGLRDRLRTSLKANGFQILQNSVWVNPYNCEDFVTLLKADFRIGRDMKYLIVDSIEGDRELRSDFGLGQH